MSDQDALFGALADEVTARVVRELRPILERIERKQRREFVSPAEAAEDLRLHVNTVYERLQDGTLPGKRVGTRWLVDLAAVRVETNDEVARQVRKARGGAR